MQKVDSLFVITMSRGSFLLLLKQNRLLVSERLFFLLVSCISHRPKRMDEAELLARAELETQLVINSFLGLLDR